MASDETVDLYGTSYGAFATELYAEVRREAFGEDLGQNGWLTAEEQDLFLEWLALDAGDRLLDVACGSGGPTLRIARRTGATVVGLDVHEQGIEAARAQAREAGIEDRADFRVADASRPLPFNDEAFVGLVCVDAVNHLADRASVLADWRRVLAPRGGLVYTDPIVVTGALTDGEMRVRSSIGPYLFVPEGYNEALLEEAGFELLAVEDRTANMARIARRWREARADREGDLREVEGEETFEGQQRFLGTTARLAEEGRLSRFVYHARLRPRA
ncbi:MAG: class I SAM-dependent methyltransferase [Gemmatimonadota bacterium]